MSKIEEKINKEKERYIKFIDANRGKNIYIYGAGRMAKPLYLFLKENGININGFCVSNKRINKKEEYGIPILQINEIKKSKEDEIFLFGVNSRLNKEIEKILKEHGFNNFLYSTEYLRYFGTYQYEFFENPMMEITTKMGCAVNCKYCPQDVLLKNYFKTGNEEKYMSFETFKTCIDKMPENVLIEFAGFTEPFFNKECLRMVLYASKKGHKLNMFTTLRGMTIEIFEQLKNIQFEEFVLHVPDNEKYANIPITDEYLELLDLIVEAKKPNGEDYIDYACAQGSIPEIIKDHLGDNVRIFISLLDRAGNIEDDRLFGKRNIQGKLQCETSLTINHNVLLPDGRVTLCAQDYGLKHILGNLLESTYEEVVYGEEAKQILDCMCNENDMSILCRNCSLAYVVNDKVK